MIYLQQGASGLVQQVCGCAVLSCAATAFQSLFCCCHSPSSLWLLLCRVGLQVQQTCAVCGGAGKTILPQTAFSNTDVGKTVSIAGDDVIVDGRVRKVKWHDVKHHNLNGKIKSVNPTYKGKVELEDGQEIENPARTPVRNLLTVRRQTRAQRCARGSMSSVGG